MAIAFLLVTVFTAVAAGLSGIAAILRVKPILEGMAKVGVPESWLVFPIGTLKSAGAVGLLLGLAGVPIVGAAAAIGLILYFVCAVYTHIRAGDYSSQFAMANAYLALATAALTLQLVHRGFH